MLVSCDMQCTDVRHSCRIESLKFMEGPDFNTFLRYDLILT